MDLILRPCSSMSLFAISEAVLSIILYCCDAALHTLLLCNLRLPVPTYSFVKGPFVGLPSATIEAASNIMLHSTRAAFNDKGNF